MSAIVVSSRNVSRSQPEIEDEERGTKRCSYANCPLSIPNKKKERKRKHKAESSFQFPESANIESPFPHNRIRVSPPPPQDGGEIQSRAPPLSVVQPEIPEKEFFLLNPQEKKKTPHFALLQTFLWVGRWRVGRCFVCSPPLSVAGRR